MEYLGPLLKILVINLVLSGDNAVVIAMAVRGIPKELQNKGIMWGTAGAVVFRIILTFAAAWLLTLPLLEFLAGVLLIWIGINLLVDDDEEQDIKGGKNLWSAMKVIIFADLIMSLDNVLAVAAAAEGNFLILIIGIALSIPIVVFGSKAVLYLMEKWPIIIYIGAAVIGHTAGEIMLSDKLILRTIEIPHSVHLVLPYLLAALVIVAGHLINKVKKLRRS
ncbi:MAG: TerC family protein [Clostridiales bacterium]|nr:TerC family protein [Clostridiales bacterium]MCF8023354.1 TerC family protein [Clostridiales bacterium]